ncbi:MAG TPA: hypothetical protein VHE61_18160 [Opitutaceae bacterium]|nr:hypothetical protein [Opitutaceae bacterium]
MSQNDSERSYDADPRIPQGIVVVAVLAIVLATGIYLIVSGLL